jgi:hypothetical protein
MTRLIVCIFLLIIIFICNCNQSQKGGENETIFVSIPSYRDKDCKNTLRQLYESAKNPELIYVGVLTQNKDESESCVVNNNFTNNIRYLNIDYKEAKGPLYARIMIINKLFKNEKYFMLIDAHTKFVNNWDEKFKDQMKFLEKQGVKKPVLSAYPNRDDEFTNNEKSIHTTHICKVLQGEHYPTVLQALQKPTGKFYKSLLIGANCLFTYGSFFKTIKFDPDLKHIFNGEEILIAAQAYTNGWNVYTPAYSLVTHKYNETMKDKNSWYEDNKNNETYNKDVSESLDILKKILTDSEYSKTYKYGLGKERTLESFWKELGFDRTKKIFSEKWTPANESRICNYGSIDYK